jgi:uncharacterized coiled-coil DUF342 family protein
MNENMTKLNDKISSLLNAYNQLKEENDNLRNQLVASQGQNETLHTKTQTLEESLLSKDSEIDSIIEKLDFL